MDRGRQLEKVNYILALKVPEDNIAYELQETLRQKMMQGGHKAQLRCLRKGLHVTLLDLYLESAEALEAAKKCVAEFQWLCS